MAKIHRKKPVYSSPGEESLYSKYKDALGNDFNGCCGYCDCPDFVWGGTAGFQIDHFAPQKKFPELLCVYGNLIYACPICNRGKWNLWPTDDALVSFKDDEGFVHPCGNDYDEHLMRGDNGSIVPLTAIGCYMFKKLKFGLARHQTIWMKEELNALIKEVRAHLDGSSDLKDKYFELLESFYQYDEQLRAMINDR